jgi:hypothetical protein
VARDDKDRTYEDEQGRPLDADLAGDVLSPRWETDATDTDEQPAVVINETYHLPPEPVEEPYHLPTEQGAVHLDQSALRGQGSGDVLDQGDVLDADPPRDPAPALDLGLPADLGHSQDPAPSFDAGRSSDAAPSLDTGFAQDPQQYAQGFDEPRAQELPGQDADRRDDDYLPVDRAYDGDDDGQRKGFLGSGWSDEPEPKPEPRRRSKTLVLAAVAVVILGAGAGWMLTNSGPEECSGAQCASVKQLSTPTVPAGEEAEAPVEEPTEEESPTPTASETVKVTPTPTVQRARAPRTQPPATSAPPRETIKPTTRGTRAPEQSRQPIDGGDTSQRDSSTREQTQAPKEESSPRESSPASAPADTQAPAPQQPATQAPENPPSKGGGGLLDWLFGG